MKNRLEEGNELSRAVTMFYKSETHMGLISACRGERPEDENITNTKEMAADIRAEGFGYRYVTGFYIENMGTPDERPVEEASFLVSAPPGEFDGGDFTERLVAIGNKYKQESVAIKTAEEGKAKLVFGDMSEMTLGDLQPQHVGEFYTRLKKGHTFGYGGEYDHTNQNAAYSPIVEPARDELKAAQDKFNNTRGKAFTGLFK